MTPPEIIDILKKHNAGAVISAVADGPYSVILDQVANGVAVRMAVLYLLAGTHEEAA